MKKWIVVTALLIFLIAAFLRLETIWSHRKTTRRKISLYPDRFNL